jgi:hypothetical protein
MVEIKTCLDQTFMDPVEAENTRIKIVSIGFEKSSCRNDFLHYIMWIKVIDIYFSE